MWRILAPSFVVPCVWRVATFGMDVKKEQRVCIKFCARLGNNETEALGMVQQAFGEESMSCARLFDWRARFRAGQTSVDDDKHTGRPFSCAMPKIIAQVQQLVRTDRRRTIQTTQMRLVLDTQHTNGF